MPYFLPTILISVYQPAFYIKWFKYSSFGNSVISVITLGLRTRLIKLKQFLDQHNLFILCLQNGTPQGSQEEIIAREQLENLKAEKVRLQNEFERRMAEFNDAVAENKRLKAQVGVF